ncbi:MAG TPA: NUDIX domain-containing protein [Candidatus Nanoarchaeia archaeon]|nr:NUDIX domain-containing protein [Candidatus Nanoarchaeia archaeon]
METRVIVSAILKNKDKYLIAKRVNSKKYAPGRWEFISGFVDSNESAEKIMLRELKEELNVNGKMIRTANPYVIIDKEARWIIIPFIINMRDTKFKLNKKDHSEIKWVSEGELAQVRDIKKEVKELKIRGMA